MQFKDILLVSDYDNTMTGEMHLVPEANYDAIRAFTAEGGAFTIASGRGKREWQRSFSEVPFNAPLILANGAVIYDTQEDRVLFQGQYSERQRQLVKELFLQLPTGCSGIVELAGASYIPDEIYEKSSFRGFPGQHIEHPPFDEIPDHWNKVIFVPPLPEWKPGQALSAEFLGSIDGSPLDEVQRIAERISINGFRSLPIMYEVPPEGADKGSSARRLLEILGRKILVCVGDAPNDLAMLHAADYCFVPRESLLTENGPLPENAILTVRCEDASLADVIRMLREM